MKVGAFWVSWSSQSWKTNSRWANKFPYFYGTLRFNAMSTIAHKWTHRLHRKSFFVCLIMELRVTKRCGHRTVHLERNPNSFLRSHILQELGNTTHIYEVSFLHLGSHCALSGTLSITEDSYRRTSHLILQLSLSRLLTKPKAHNNNMLFLFWLLQYGSTILLYSRNTLEKLKSDSKSLKLKHCTADLQI